MQWQEGSRVGGCRAGTVNKKFLINTVRGLKSHNKREEEEDCWRQHDLDQKAQQRQQRPSLSHNTCRARRPEISIIDTAATKASTDASEVDTREFWAEQKQRVMTAASSSSVGTAATGTIYNFPLAAATAATAREGGQEPKGEHCDDYKSRKRARVDEGTDSSTIGSDVGKKEKKKKAKKKHRKRKRESRRHHVKPDAEYGDSSVEEDTQTEREGGGDGEAVHRRRKKSKKRDAEKKKNKK